MHLRTLAMATASREGTTKMAVPNMNGSIHEDNLGAFVLAKTLPPQFTPQSKYYTIKTIWFCEEIFKRNVQFLHIINTVE